MKLAPVTTMMVAPYMLLLPATAWALSGSVTSPAVAPAAPVAPAVASTATRVAGIVARIQNALDEACATEAASAAAAPAPLAVGALATGGGRRELAARLRAKHYAVLRLPGFDGGRLRSAAEALLDDICGFLEDRPGRAAPTGLIVDAFSHRVKDKGMFRRLLKQAARLEKGAGTAQWVLRDEFA